MKQTARRIDQERRTMRRALATAVIPLGNIDGISDVGVELIEAPSVDVQRAHLEGLAVGAVYVNVTGADPATELGYGTWVQFGAGRTLVGRDAGDADFDTALETGGAKTVAAAGTVAAPTISGATATEGAHTHTYTEVPNHTHPVNVTDPGHLHIVPIVSESEGGPGDRAAQGREASDVDMDVGSATTGITATTSNPTGGVATGTTNAGTAHSHGPGTLAASAPAFTPTATSVVQPYVVVHFWRRTS